MDILTKIQVTSVLAMFCFWMLIVVRPDCNINKNFKYLVFTSAGVLLSTCVALVSTLWIVWTS